MRVLLVERSPFLRLLLREVLTRANHETIAECVELDEAAALACVLCPDVVLLDLDETYGDLMAKLERLRLGTPRATLIALGPPGGHPRAESGLAAYLDKPCTPEAVLAAIHGLCAQDGILPA